MSLPYFPMYPTDFEADTSHLTLAEDGAYNRLLRLMWMTSGCSLPDDDAWILRRMRCADEVERGIVLAIIDEFFVRSDGRVSNARLTKEFAKSNESHKRRVSAGSKGGKAKALKTNDIEHSNAIAKRKQPEPEPEPLKRDTKVSPKKGTRLPDDWELPEEYGEWAISEGWDKDSIKFEADKFKDWWISKSGKDATKMDWKATWRNWLRNSKTPKRTQTTGCRNGSTGQTDKLRRIITAAAEGTSGQGWG